MRVATSTTVRLVPSPLRSLFGGEDKEFTLLASSIRVGSPRQLSRHKFIALEVDRQFAQRSADARRVEIDRERPHISTAAGQG
jgi:hypothetical protein